MKPTKIYAEVLEDSALEQFNSAMECDFSVKGALMADAHTGYSMPIGGVIATKGVVVPSWIGYDIGCGMCAVETTFDVNDIRENSEAIFQQICRDVPVGFKINETESATKLNHFNLSDEGKKIFEKKNGYMALGSLGGGNHFIEIGVDENSNVWIVVHSGSRGVGHGIAQNYMCLASPTGKATEGHYGLDVNTTEGMAYINDMNWCLAYAYENRKLIIDKVIYSINRHCRGRSIGFVNRNHNHAELKDGLWIHRKGATHAENGMMGVIPGNMRDGSFIVMGKGNVDSLCSSSHGAGRVLGRRKAKETLDVEEFKKEMVGVVAKVGNKTLDESPMAYKNIFEVMDLQKDLLRVVHHIKPLINIKG